MIKLVIWVLVIGRNYLILIVLLIRLILVLILSY